MGTSARVPELRIRCLLRSGPSADNTYRRPIIFLFSRLSAGDPCGYLQGSSFSQIAVELDIDISMYPNCFPSVLGRISIEPPLNLAHYRGPRQEGFGTKSVTACRGPNIVGFAKGIFTCQGPYVLADSYQFGKPLKIIALGADGL